MLEDDSNAFNDFDSQIRSILTDDPDFVIAKFNGVKVAMASSVAYTLAIALNNNSNIKVLELRNTCFGLRDVEKVFDALHCHPSITSIYISGEMFDSEIDVMQSLSSLLACTKISEVYLSNFSIGDEAGRFIVESMSLLSAHGKCFKRLYMDNCNVGDKTAAALLEFIYESSRLERLHLAANHFTRYAVQGLVNSMKAQRINSDLMI